MGSVWEGRHSTLGTRVAIKFIDQEYADSKEARSRFDTEARAAAALQSKHAIQIYDHGVTDDGRPYMVMELLAGEPLDERIDRVGRMPLEDTARIVAQVCRALQRAHDAGIIHRDLKPENIFLVRSPDDDDEIAKVLDFGIAKIKTPPGEEGLSSSTKTGAVLGTPYYMAPGAGARAADDRLPRGPLVARHHRVQVRHRRAAFRGRERRRSPREDLHRRPPGPVADGPGSAARLRRVVRAHDGARARRGASRPRPSWPTALAVAAGAERAARARCRASGDGRRADAPTRRRRQPRFRRRCPAAGAHVGALRHVGVSRRSRRAAFSSPSPPRRSSAGASASSAS